MPVIYEPKTMYSLLSIIKKYPDAFIYSSGLEKICQFREKTVSFDNDIIYIERIEELQRMDRSERYIDIGSATRINNIIDKGKNIIPAILLKAMEKITPPNFKNILTIGGLVCLKNKRSNIFSVLSILDAKLEIRSRSSSKWISINHLFNDNNVINLLPGEIITKIRLYLEDYDISIYREIDNDFSCEDTSIPCDFFRASRSVAAQDAVPAPSFQQGEAQETLTQSSDSSKYGNATLNESPIIFSALASLTKKNINFIKFIFSTSDTFVIRSKEIESNLTDQNIPFNDKLTATIISQFKEYLDKKYNTIKNHRKNIILNTLDWFIKELDYFSI